MSFAIPGLGQFLNAPCKVGEEWIALILAAVLTGKSISWYINSECGVVEENNRKTRVSVPAPSEMICFFVCCSGCDSINRETRRSIAVVRTYVPVQIHYPLASHPTSRSSVELRAHTSIDNRKPPRLQPSRRQWLREPILDIS